MRDAIICGCDKSNSLLCYRAETVTSILGMRFRHPCECPCHDKTPWTGTYEAPHNSTLPGWVRDWVNQRNKHRH